MLGTYISVLVSILEAQHTLPGITDAWRRKRGFRIVLVILRENKKFLKNKKKTRIHAFGVIYFFWLTCQEVRWRWQ